MKVIYISGAYSDERGAFYIRANIREAERMAIWVWLNGAVALCPHLNTALFDGAFGIPDSTWLDGDIELISRCDAVFAIPSYVKSHGAQVEIEYANDLGIPVLYSQGEVSRFIAKDDNDGQDSKTDDN